MNAPFDLLTSRFWVVDFVVDYHGLHCCCCCYYCTHHLDSEHHVESGTTHHSILQGERERESQMHICYLAKQVVYRLIHSHRFHRFENNC